VRDQVYWASFDDEDSALFLVALLNSAYVMEAIRDWMTRGLFGPRHIHKRVLDVPWPRFQPKDVRHIALVEACQSLLSEAQALAADLPKMSGGRQRTWLREHLDQSKLREVEKLVAAISTGGG
jgi:hypothetical protein